MSYIEFRNVTKVYHVGEVDIHALDGADFSVEKGQFIVIAGASGAGKSTILNILGGMDTCTTGEIIVDGVRVDQMDENQLTDYRRYDIGFVFQFYNLVQNLTALENVELATEICRDPLNPSEVLKQVGLEERMHNFPSQLSGGEQQRVAIARALAKNPKLLLCDEPTGALDYVTGKQSLKLLQQTCRDLGMSVIIITHNLALCPMGDRVFRVKSGRIISAETNEHPQDIDTIEW
ncbi:MAG: ABC transporter ATP-binding protein [Solobacterium sp.]|nr:ABC transporter ATP-binding protein [Solobacterium sp.]